MLIHSLLVSGTLRSNLDPFGLHDDARLWDALKRSYLVETSKADDGNDISEGALTSMNRFSLDTVIEDEGNNLSIGQVRRFILLLEINSLTPSAAIAGLSGSRTRQGHQHPDPRRGYRLVYVQVSQAASAHTYISVRRLRDR